MLLRTQKEACPPWLVSGSSSRGRSKTRPKPQRSCGASSQIASSVADRLSVPISLRHASHPSRSGYREEHSMIPTSISIPHSYYIFQLPDYGMMQPGTSRISHNCRNVSTRCVITTMLVLSAPTTARERRHRYTHPLALSAMAYGPRAGSHGIGLTQQCTNTPAT